MRAVQWPMPGILKAPAPVEELERSVRAGSRSSRSPTPLRNWISNADRGWAERREQVEEKDESDIVKKQQQNTLLPLRHTHTYTPLSVCFWPTLQLRRGVRPAEPGSTPDASTGGRCTSSASPALWPTGAVCCERIEVLRGTVSLLPS